MTQHQAFRKFCHFLKKVGFYKEYWHIVYKAGFSKAYIREVVIPDKFIISMVEYSNGIINRLKFHEFSIKWRKELHPYKKSINALWRI